ncbi:MULTISPECIES: NAD(P)/FAD-dependent oxidoreductase [unclassified Aureimonas]|uniref:NAD(P)/FAD-dependent oxidoreductase n=1 Tax=unclassified Aureimonas TaxID=2615206 RepID=UPI0006FC2C40|nr:MULTISPECIES: FAD-dependent oxidoreductase [unclassified Aureimonas]KQT69673.1 hypothetical protein ASG62_00645 [Aureimonas sp. Leaf427]KQT76174.1 hypothetical protein ASG54_15575 [Aureimonas sp. Leaf460]
MTAGTVVIAGAGQAGLQVAVSLRAGGFGGRIVLVGEETRLPYQRPPLSKAYLKADAATDSLLLKPDAFYETNRIETLLGTRVQAIDRAGRRVALSDGGHLAYDHLVLATGARNRLPPLSGVHRPNVHALRDAGEAERLREALVAGARLVVVGGGFIGLEVAASARARGLDVTVLEGAARLMGRVVSPVLSDFFLDAHGAMGTTVRLGAAVAGIEGEGEAGPATGVRLANGEVLPADLVLLATGVVPNAEIAAEAGLATEGGVHVDRFMTTSDPAIFAIGDCAVFESPFAEGPVRLESVQNAIDQAKCVAARILGGTAPYRSVPWFWSDQGSFKLQIVGITTGADHVHLAGSREDGRLVAYCFRGNRLLGIETVNRPGEHMLGRRILEGDLKVLREDVSAEDFDLKRHLAELSAKV